MCIENKYIFCRSRHFSIFKNLQQRLLQHDSWKFIPNFFLEFFLTFDLILAPEKCTWPKILRLEFAFQSLLKFRFFLKPLLRSVGLSNCLYSLMCLHQISRFYFDGKIFTSILDRKNDSGDNKRHMARSPTWNSPHGLRLQLSYLENL